MMDYGQFNSAAPQDMLTDVVQSQPQSVLPMTRRARLLKLQQQAAEMEGAEPDVSQLQEFAAAQGKAGEASMLNALAAQYAGESFQPVQAQFLKRAMAAQDPMKIGSGMLTPDGKFIRDPFSARERSVGRLDRLIQAEQGAITAEDVAAQRRADAEQRRLDALERQQSQQQYQRDSLELRRLAVEAANAARNAAAGGRTDKAADTLRGEYLKRNDKIQEGIGHGQNVIQMLSDPTIATDPTKQVGLIFSFGKMLDPDSVVRESEYALIANARGISDTLQQLIPRIQSGARLTPQQLQSMQQVATNLMSGANTRRKDLDNYYTDLAQRRKIDPRDVLPSYRADGGGGGRVVDFNSLPKGN
jgi:hypothetical protein